MEDQKTALIEKLKGANNILVTVSSSPSVDQLASAIGLTIFLNKLKKHATAVFSGDIPSTIEFLQPEDTLEKTTDSLRDFIISLDKSKADKLRYKVEENVVKIFITPYRTSLSQADLDFSQGDFNVDVVLALGVHEQKDLDQAIMSHGRILHDATVMSVNIQPGPELGSINWTAPDASSLSELAVEVSDALNPDLLDGQIATAYLTGIVAETERFSNEKTSPVTMRMSAELLAAGANQQLVSSELQKDDEPPETDTAMPIDDQPKPPGDNDGTLEITHQGGTQETGSEEADQADTANDEGVHDVKQNTFEEPPLEVESLHAHSELPAPHYITEPPVMGGQLTSGTAYEDPDEVQPMTGDSTDMPLLGHDSMDKVSSQPVVTNPDQVGQIAEQQPVWHPEPHHSLASQPNGQIHSSDTNEPPMELPTPDPSTGSSDGAYQPLDTEPAPSATPPPIGPLPSANFGDQIHIDPEGNIDGLSQSSTPMSESVKPPTDVLNARVPDTLADIEEAVHSPHLQAEQVNQGSESDIDAALKAVQDVYNSTPVDPNNLPPKQDVGASGYLKIQDLPAINEPTPTQPDLNAPLPPSPFAQPSVETTQPPMVAEPMPGNTPADTPLTMPLPPAMPLPPVQSAPPNSLAAEQTPPPVPPPLPPSMMTPPQG